jgi:F0F1-type ATP synthase membrane subunit a
MALGALVAVLQAFVFSLLTMIYISMAQEEPH